MTEWRPVPGYEGRYEVSSSGAVRSLITERVLKQSRTRQYLAVGLHLNGKARRRYVAHLVLEAFVGPRPPGLVACHEDDDPDNNSVSNLRWGTMSSNRRDSVRNGTHHYARRTHCSEGHEFTAENTMTRPDGGRRCRTCKRKQERKAG